MKKDQQTKNLLTKPHKQDSVSESIIQDLPIESIDNNPFSESDKLDPLTESYNIGVRDRETFDWPDTEAVLEKVTEELIELKESLDQGRLNQAHELGDLLFSIAQVSRHLQINPSLALQVANDRYQIRFATMKKLIATEALDFAALDLKQLETYWSKAKKLTKDSEIATLAKHFSITKNSPEV